PARTFTNPQTITLPGILRGPGDPYPSTILVSGFTAAVFKVTATVSNLSHMFPADLDFLLIGPAGQKTYLMSDAGLDFAIDNVTVTFDDAAATLVPRTNQITAGSYRPTNYGSSSDDFPSPAPAPPYVTN